jgi:hypothetical protein
MPPLEVPPNPFFHVCPGSGFRRLWKHSSMNVLGTIAASLSHHDSTTFFIPFQNRTRTDPKFLTDLGGNRDLTLRGEL